MFYVVLVQVHGHVHNHCLTFSLEKTPLQLTNIIFPSLLKNNGELVAALLNGFANERSAENLTEIAFPLLNSGAGALAWWRIRNTGLRNTEIAEELHQAYRLHTLQAAVKELEISQLFTYLRAQGLEPLLGKGWAIARHYPEPGLRPYGDIDLYVRPEQYQQFVEALSQPEAQGWNVDLHHGAAELDDRSFDDLYAHSELVLCNDVAVRIFGAEDLLRLLCLHLLREGALRPLWLCDIAVALQTLSTQHSALSFDWDYFLSGNQRRTDWAACAIGLAHQILGANVDGLPIASRAKNLPRWLVSEVLREWGTGKVTHGRRAPMSGQLRHPLTIWHSLRERWPNKIEATVRVKAPMNNWPRWPLQLWECVQRVIGFAGQTPKLMRKETVIMK